MTKKDDWRQLRAERRKRLDTARESRERGKVIGDVFREIVKRAGLTRGEMIEMYKRLPDWREEYVDYLSSQPSPDYESCFEVLLLLYLSSS
jgi:hypothetical protein